MPTGQPWQVSHWRAAVDSGWQRSCGRGVLCGRLAAAAGCRGRVDTAPAVAFPFVWWQLVLGGLHPGWSGDDRQPLIHTHMPSGMVDQPVMVMAQQYHVR